MRPTPARLLLWRFAVTTLTAAMVAAIAVASIVAPDLSGSAPDAASESGRITERVR